MDTFWLSKAISKGIFVISVVYIVIVIVMNNTWQVTCENLRGNYFIHAQKKDYIELCTWFDVY